MANTIRMSDEILEFVASPVMIIVGTRDPSNRPSIARAVGARVVDKGTIEIFVSAWQWPETIANLAATGQAAITFARPADYVSYQLKGIAQMRAAEPPDLELSRHYRENIFALLGGLGLQHEVIVPWLADRELHVARLAVREAYVQTPGPKAGTAVAAGTDGGAT